MNFTESFSEFSSKLGPTDLALYAGAGIIIWVLFKDRMSPVQEVVAKIIEQVKSMMGQKSKTVLPPSLNVKAPESTDKDLFFDLVVSWKQTRDLAVRSGCDKAVEVADQMFPYLSPMVCEDVTEKKEPDNDTE